MIHRPLFRTLIVACAAVAITQSLKAADFPKDLYDCCCDDCCKQSHITTDTKKVAKRVYGEKCQDFCLPHTNHHGSCDCCVSCEKIRTRKYLVVKIREHEECVNKCVVEHVPSGCSQCACPLAAEPRVTDTSAMVSSPNGDELLSADPAANPSPGVGAWLKATLTSSRRAR